MGLQRVGHNWVTFTFHFNHFVGLLLCPWTWGIFLLFVSNYHTIACSKFSKPGFNNMWTENFQMFKLDLEKAEEAQLNCQHPLDHRKAREFQKNISFYFTDYTDDFDCVDHKLWKILQEMGIPDYLTCLLRNLYAGQEATVRTRKRTMDWFQIEKGVNQGNILSSCLFKL